MAFHVYLLRHAQHPRFKIGKANDILSRARSFDWSSIDFDGSLGLSMASEAAAYSLERILHRTFHYARFPIDVVVSSGDRTDGASEWFDISCMPRLLRYLADNAGFLKGLLFRMRYAHVRQESPVETDLDDFRLMIYYDPPNF